MVTAMRLIDLHCDWLCQYAAETTIYDPTFYTDVQPRLRRLSGYLQGTALTLLYAGRQAQEWEQRDDRWRALAELLALSEAEFPGRLLIGPDDVARCGRNRRTVFAGVCWPWRASTSLSASRPTSIVCRHSLSAEFGFFNWSTARPVPSPEARNPAMIVA